MKTGVFKVKYNLYTRQKENGNVKFGWQGQCLERCPFGFSW